MPRSTDFKGIFIEPNEILHGRPRWSGTDHGASKHQFYTNTVRDLRRIAQIPLGAELLDLIGKRSEGTGTSASGAARSVTIIFRPSSDNQGASAGAMSINDRFRVTRSFGGQSFSFAGKGSASKIRMHNDAASDAIYTQLAGLQTPAWIALAHELIHALHHLSGTAYGDSVQAAGGEVKREEMWTTGLGPYANTRLSENKIRAAAGLPPRTFYTFVDDHTNMPSLMSRMAMPRPGFWYCACLQERFGDL